MRKVIGYVIANLLLAACAFAGVTISSPAPGSTPTSPVHFIASASSSLPIAAMRIYVDNTSVFTTSNSQLDTFVTLSTGTHNVVMVAWDNQGNPLTASESITVTAGTANVSVSAPANNATVGSPFQVVASATAPSGISAMNIYLDDQVAFRTSSSSLNTPITAGAGSHSVVVQAWDNNGTVYKTPLTVNVSASTSSGVKVSAPANNATVSSPFTVTASASAPNPIVAMHIYLDDQVVFQNNASSLNTQVSAGVGTHSVVVQAWDNTGAVYKQPLTVNVSSTAPPASGVTISSPGNGASTSSPIHVVASASASQPIAAMRIYLDSNNMYTVNSSQIDTSVSASTGSHDLVVVAWDTNGNPYKQELTVNVTGSSGPPSGATTVKEIQQIGGWGSCTVCAGAGGNGPAAQYSTQQGVGSPSLSGSSMQFNIWGSTPWSDVLWWKDLTPNDNATNFQYDLDFYITQPQRSQALEFDVNFIDGSTGTYYIFGTQCNIGDGQFDVWDTAGNTWVHTGITCNAPAANVWHHLTWEFSRTSSKANFIAVTFDGVKHYVNMTFWAKPGGNSGVGIAFQMDGDANMDAYSVWLDNVTLSYW